MKRGENMTELFEGREIVVNALVGSHAHNLQTPESDRDFKLFITPTFEDLFNGTMFSFADISDTVDFSVHDVRKLGEQIWKGNINFLQVLFNPEGTHDNGLDFLFENRERIAQANIPNFLNSTMGMHREKMSTLHKGTGNTQHLIEKFGFDTKQAHHAIRCLFTIEKFWETDSMEKALWFNKGKKRTILMDIKAGKFTEAEVKAIAEEWFAKKWDGEMKKNFCDTELNWSVKEELNNFIFEFVKKKILG